MLTRTKLGTGFILFVFLFTMLAGVLPTHVVHAQPHEYFQSPPFNGGPYTLKDGKITVTTNSPDQTIITFSDSNPNDTNYTYTSNQKMFCSISSNDDTVATIKLSAKPTGKKVSGTLSAFWYSAERGCSATSDKNISIDNADGGGTGSSLPAQIKYGSSDITYYLVDPQYGLYGLKKTLGTDCFGGSVIATNPAGTDGTIYLNLSYSASGTQTNSLAKSLDNGGYTKAASAVPGCYFASPADAAGIKTGIKNGKTTVEPIPKDPQAESQSCESQNPGPLSWIMCPVINVLGDTVDALNNAVNDLLFFDLAPNGDFGSGDVNKSGVKEAWSSIKNIASIVLIIIMLVMVLSEAIGVGVFDAYAIRKVLPRLVVAVIAMQLSWALCVWALHITNDVGQGIADILYQPFGGENAMSFKVVAGNLGLSADVTFLAGAATAAFVNPFTLMLLAISIFSSLFIGFLVLIARKMIIILAVMLAPLALLAWILPGTQKYWKLWFETFTKLLIMYPLILALLAAGRILAKITVETQLNGGPDLLTFFVLCIGFFGPFLLLPKLFSTSGRILGSIAGITNDRSKGIFDRARGFSETRRKELSAQRRATTGDRLARGNYDNMRFGKTRKGIDMMKGGQLDPTIAFGKSASRVRNQKLASIKAAGRGIEQQELKDASESLQTRTAALDYDDTKALLYATAIGRTIAIDEDGKVKRDPSNGNKPIYGTTKTNDSEVTRRAAASQLVGYGDYDLIKGMEKSIAADKDNILLNKVKSENAGAIRAVGPNLLGDVNNPADLKASMDRSNDEVLAGMKFGAWNDYLDTAAGGRPIEAIQRYDRIMAGASADKVDNQVHARIREMRASTPGAPIEPESTARALGSTARSSGTSAPSSGGGAATETVITREVAGGGARQQASEGTFNIRNAPSGSGQDASGSVVRPSGVRSVPDSQGRPGNIILPSGVRSVPDARDLSRAADVEQERLRREQENNNPPTPPTE